MIEERIEDFLEEILVDLERRLEIALLFVDKSACFFNSVLLADEKAVI